MVLQPTIEEEPEEEVMGEVVVMGETVREVTTVCLTKILTAVCIIQGMRLFILKKNKCLMNVISPSILHGMI